MSRPCPARAGSGAPTGVELADVVRAHAHALTGLGLPESRALGAIRHCRTAILGGHAYQCDRCAYREISYNSCRNRHCPKCQAQRQHDWLVARQAELLPVPYFHVVFTIPAELRAMFRRSPKVSYGLLFAAVSETLTEVARNPRHLDARVGFLAILHTWTQTLLYHPHIHCVVPGGGLSPDGSEWRPSRHGFLLPIRVLSVVFRGKLLSKLEAALRQGHITDPGQTAFRELRRAARKRWNVYSKAPFGGPKHVLAYLGRYTHRVAISNRRLVALDDGRVTFRYRDRSDGNREKLLRLDALDFLRRFLSHVVPDGFVRIRSFGFLANSVKREQLARCRAALAVTDPPIDSCTDEPPAPIGRDPQRCPACEHGKLQIIARLVAMPRDWRHRGRATFHWPSPPAP